MSQLFPSNGKRHDSRVIKNPRQYFDMYQQVVARLPFAAIEQVAMDLLHAYEKDHTIFLFGNGGSAALASHFACDLGKGTIANGNRTKRFRAMALTDNVPLVTAWANDDCYE